MGGVKPGCVVQVLISIREKGGEKYLSTPRDNPIEFTVGAGTMLPAIEEALGDMQPRETKSFGVPHDRAFGPYRRELLWTYERNDLPEAFEPEVGQTLRMPGPGGREVPLVITGVTETHVTMDGNHPLAGKDVVIRVELLNVA